MTSPLLDQLQRPLRDLRISVTDRCNFRCTYCMPKAVYDDHYAFLPKQALLSYEEIRRLAALFASLGVRKIRITGGEPLLRNNLAELIEQLGSVRGIEDIALTTNGLLLDRYGQELRDAGLKRLNISLDALDPHIFGLMNGRGIKPDAILHNIAYAMRLGFEVKVNMVVQKGVNDGEIVPMARYFKDQDITLRFIEYMDVGNDNGWCFDQVVAKRDILQILQQHFELKPAERGYYGEVAQYYHYANSTARVGFVTSVTETFCSTCTRARLSSDGKLYTCLFATQGFDVRELLRSGATDDEIVQEIARVWRRRTDRYSDERTEMTARLGDKIRMSYIGG